MTILDQIKDGQPVWQINSEPCLKKRKKAPKQNTCIVPLQTEQTPDFLQRQILLSVILSHLSYQEAIFLTKMI